MTRHGQGDGQDMDKGDDKTWINILQLLLVCFLRRHTEEEKEEEKVAGHLVDILNKRNHPIAYTYSVRYMQCPINIL